MPPIDAQPATLFHPRITRATAVGAALGGIGVIAMFGLGVVVTDSDLAVIGAAGLAAPFGGAGFGAMLGAVLGAIRVAEEEAEAERAERQTEG